MDTFITYIQELCEQVAQPDAAATEIAQSIGNITERIFQSILVTPAHDEWLQSVTVNQNADDDNVNHIELHLNEPMLLDVLETTFGSYKRMRGGSKASSEATFGIQAQSDTHTATLMAAIKQNTTQQITVRRDIRLV